MNKKIDPAATIEAGAEKLKQLRTVLAETIVGQEETITHLLTGVLTSGHILLVGVPGLAKTLLVKALAQALGWTFRRIQFTPDLMPSDITGGEVLHIDPDTGEKSFRFLKGPIFTHFLLADEINRTPPKTQSALLEAMQEQAVTAGGKTYPLSQPFLVVATQNPIEQEGTYPLPEAQLDRFLLSLVMTYPSEAEEGAIAGLTSGPAVPLPEQTVDVSDLLAVVRHVPVPPSLAAYAVKLVRRTRPGQPGSLDCVEGAVRWGAGPRASQHLLLAAKARAVLDGHFAVTRQDIADTVKPVLRHRLVMRFHGLSGKTTADEVLDAILEKTSSS